MGKIVIFSKPHCSHCDGVKARLKANAIPYHDIDVSDDSDKQQLMTFLTERYTVPQIFFQDMHIGGAVEFKLLKKPELLECAKTALNEPGEPSFLTAKYDEQVLAQSVLPLRTVLDAPNLDEIVDQPAMAPAVTFYKGGFGHIPNAFQYLMLKPEQTAVWMALEACTLNLAIQSIGEGFAPVAFTSAMTAGCSYCAAHTFDRGVRALGADSQIMNTLHDWLRNDYPIDSLLLSEKHRVLVKLARATTDFTLAGSDLEKLREAIGLDTLNRFCDGVGNSLITMGFLNRFNDMVGIEVEASVKQHVGAVFDDAWQWGVHNTEDQLDALAYVDSSNALSPFNPDAADTVKALIMEQALPFVEKYEDYEDWQLPAWLNSFKDAETRRSAMALYQSTLNVGSVASTTKHQMAFALAMLTGFDAIAKEESRIALSQTMDGQKINLDLKLKLIAEGAWQDSSLFSIEEQLALRLADCATQSPPLVSGGLARALNKHFSASEIVEMVMALCTIGVAQRWLTLQNAIHQFTLDL